MYVRKAEIGLGDNTWGLFCWSSKLSTPMEHRCESVFKRPDRLFGARAYRQGLDRSGGVWDMQEERTDERGKQTQQGQPI